MPDNITKTSPRSELLSLRLDALGGAKDEWIAREMSAAAARLDLVIRVAFNGVDMYAFPGDGPTRIMERLRCDQEREKK